MFSWPPLNLAIGSEALAQTSERRREPREDRWLAELGYWVLYNVGPGACDARASEKPRLGLCVTLFRSLAWRPPGSPPLRAARPLRSARNRPSLK
jgi:hypothetical protein